VRQTKPIFVVFGLEMRDGRRNKANSDRFLIAAAVRAPQIRKAELEIRDKSEVQMVQTHGRRQTKPIWGGGADSAMGHFSGVGLEGWGFAGIMARSRKNRMLDLLWETI